MSLPLTVVLLALSQAQAPSAPTPAAAAPVTATAPAVAPAPPAHPWTGSGTLGFIWLTGNTSTVTLNATATAGKQWGDWAVGFKAFGTYGQGRLAVGGPTQVTADTAGIQARGDRSLTSRLSTFVQGGAETNHIKSVKYSAFGEAGMSYIFWDLKQGDFQKGLLRTDLAARYAHENRHQYFPTSADVPSVDLFGPRAGIFFRYASSKEVVFTEEGEVVPDVTGTGRVLVNSTTKLTSKLTTTVSLAVAFQVSYDSAPAPGKVPTDTATTVGLQYSL